MDIPWWYYLISLVFGLAVWRIWKKPSLGLLTGYAFLILTETVFIRKPYTGEHLKLELLWSWTEWNVQKSQILANVIMFIPIGVLAGSLWKWKGLWFAAGISFFVEFLQLITKRGLLEFDDLLHNCIGAAIDIALVVLVKQKKREKICDK